MVLREMSQISLPKFKTRTNESAVSLATDNSVTAEHFCVKVLKNLLCNRVSVMEIIAFQSVGVYLGSEWSLMKRIETAWWAEGEKEFIAVNRKKNGDLKERKEMNYITVETFVEKCSLWPCGAENIQL
jgi:hypothetical protein